MISHLYIGTTGDYPPFSYYDSISGELTGFDVELTKLVCDNLGLTYSFVNTTWGTFESELETGKFDLAVGGISLNSNREQRFLISMSSMHDGKIPIVHIDNKHKFTTLDEIDQPSVKIIVNPGGTNEAFARKQLKQAEIIVFDNNNLIFEQIANKNADVMITDRIEALYQQRVNNKLYAVNPEHLLTHEKYGFLFAQKNHDLKDMVDQQLQILQDTIQYNQLKTSYLNT